MSILRLGITVPVCSFRKPYARMYLESERFPPPSTVYGFLLSLIGEEDRSKYIGTRIAIAIHETPSVSQILRTSWRVKGKKIGPGIESNRCPDFQEVLTGLELAVWIDEGDLQSKLSVLQKPDEIVRFGGLSLGESRDLVNDITVNPSLYWDSCIWLVKAERGMLSLPVWVDHVGSAGTRWERFSFKEAEYSDSVLEKAWMTILPPE